MIYYIDFRVLQKFNQFGVLNTPRRARTRTVQDGPKRERVIQAMIDEPHQSARGVARNLGILPTIYNTLRFMIRVT